MTKDNEDTTGRDTLLIMVSGIAGAYLSKALSMFSFWWFVLYSLTTMVGVYVVLAVLIPYLKKKGT